ncbi:putative HhH-GPD family protein [Couchioplanes caeruleus]|uniref:Putative HhH-GPD family protein n=1 Tax=Couchioplanes caeruleus TaxID=56438 RepID=A0A3N1GR80_9ACTN|nr:putative HhH-GPD family protein [Couchioplanes caeruleus]
MHPTQRLKRRFRPVSVDHAEGEAAAILRRSFFQEASLVLNNEPCQGPYDCDVSVPQMLPPGKILHVYVRYPDGPTGTPPEVCRALVGGYDGDAANLWRDAADAHELLKRVAALPGFGKQKSQIFVALLGKQCGVQPPGWREAAGAYGEEGSHRSVADIVDGDSLARVRSFKIEMKAAAKSASAG